MILNGQSKQLLEPVIKWLTFEVKLSYLHRDVGEAECCEDLPPDLLTSTRLALTPAHLDDSSDEHFLNTNNTMAINLFVGEQYVDIPSVPFNEENLPAGNVVDGHQHDGAEVPHLQCQGNDDLMPITNTVQTDDEILVLEPEFNKSDHIDFSYADSYKHALNCQCLKLKLASGVIEISAAQRIGLLLNDRI